MALTSCSHKFQIAVCLSICSIYFYMLISTSNPNYGTYFVAHIHYVLEQQEKHWCVTLLSPGVDVAADTYIFKNHVNKFWGILQLTCNPLEWEGVLSHDNQTGVFNVALTSFYL